MQRLDLRQLLSQKLSPQQIQFIKLLQIPTVELEARIKEEMEVNPALEEGREESENEYSDSESEDYDSEDDYGKDEVDINDYLNDDEISGYKMQGDRGGDEEDREMPIAMSSSLNDNLMDQLGFLALDDKQYTIGMQLIGSIDSDGYIRRELSSIANDLAFSQNVMTTEEEIEQVLHMVQTFDPAGIGARDLPECLLLQLERREQDETTRLAERIIKESFDEFTKKHYQKIQSKFNVSEDELKKAIDVIIKLNPKPGGSGAGMARVQYIIPDFILTNENGQLQLSLNSRNAPDLRISRSYADMFDAYDKSDKKDKKLKETVTFVKQKLDAAKWFIDAIRQRQNTLLRTMESIIKYQHEFFLEGDESKLRPMILKDIAEDIGMDISTVSRVANSKAVQTEFGIYPLKYFFSEGIATDSGEDASSREVKHILKEIIDKESKRKPLSDEKIEKMLNDKGYNIARRTVAKYREQLNIPVARLRKEL
ncbi:RNA polymerase factor sigma-54 [Pontibacter sp. BT731]|uniref:RNA polymerase factor sigma-54 n=1 Tax=Pontibacter TaxID=323449 RepID=UPI00209FDC4D|nr:MULTISPECIES: RNA polymerase factor sigma-54 [unclassified Pontibacter]MCP2042798.1 RNA polymerase sigma-54 factor [Pontibacter sp. HSC-36F09]MDO6390575.1 RNA polymerase factor sigma-54 [Pontibacter sp. BT731]